MPGLPAAQPGAPAQVPAGALLAGLHAGQEWAARALVEQYGRLVRRVLVRVLGSGDAEHEDLLQEVFARAIPGAARVRQAEALPGWLAGIAVFVARECIRRRQRGRSLRERLLGGPASVDAQPIAGAGVSADHGAREAARCVYRVLSAMPADERIALALRKIDGMELTELAGVLGVSVATVRRRLARAERRFGKLAKRYEALAPWLGAEEDAR